MDIEIETNVPMPADLELTASLTPAVFERLEIGHSFAVDRCGSRPDGIDRAYIIVQIESYNWGNNIQPRRRFETRIVDENTVRCWRVS
jgi:hypothetical protein